MGYKYQSLAQDHGETMASMQKLNVNLKWIPDVDGSAKIARLVGYHLRDITLHGACAGPARLHLVPHVQCRVADLPVRRVMFGRHLIADLTLPYGKVLLDYLR
ncbi:MAG TPA: acetoacetate decarboxylase family protein [Acetobacteraceae bacterium]|nr:acetoacetate decarboxylase family protein [Acetobacteraceae bacterium]